MQGQAGDEPFLRSVMNLRAKLPGDTSSGGTASGGAQDAATPPPLPPPQLVKLWDAPDAAAGLAWLTPSQLAVATAAQAGATLRLYSASGVSSEL